MSVEFKCGDPAGLVGYLYGECDDAERQALDSHLAVCATCASEIAALGATRTALAAWTPPDAKLGFRITSTDEGVERQREVARVLRPARWWQRPLPAWAQAAAALIIFGVGMTLGMRTSPSAPESSTASTAAAVGAPASPAASVSPQDLAALERRLRAEMAALRPASEAPVPAASTDASVMRLVRNLVAESEERQQRELAVRLAQALRDVEAQRRMDLTRIEQTFGQMEGFIRPELATQRQMMNYFIQRTGGQRPQE